MTRVLQAVGGFCYRFRKTVVAVWILFVLGLSIFAFQLPTVLKGSGFVMEGSYADVNRVLKDHFHVYESTLMVVYEKQEGVADERFHSFVDDTLKKMQELKLEGLVNIAGPFKDADIRADAPMVRGNIAYAVLSFELAPQDMKANIAAVRKAADTFKQDEVSVKLTGTPIIEEDLNTASQKDLARAEMIGLPVAMIVLLFAFGGLIAAGLPLAIGLLSVISAMGILYFVGLQMELSVFLLNVVVMLGLALGIDFALLFVNRFRQELTVHSVQEAVITSVLTAGESIVFSGMCVFIGLASMMFIQVDIFKAVALGGMTVVLFSILTALTLLPALLSILGGRINRLMLLKPRKGKESVWLTFSRFVIKRPVIMALSAFLVLAVSLLPVRSVELNIPGTDALPQGYESKIAYETYENTFTDKDAAGVILIAETKAQATDKASLEALYRLDKRLQADPQVAKVESIFTLAGGLNPEQLLAALGSPATAARLAPVTGQMTSGNLSMIQVELTSGPFDESTKSWVRASEKTEDGVKLTIGGYPKFNQEIFDELYSKVGYSIALIFGATYLILFIAFRSVLIPLKAILMNALSLCATFGLIILIFQEGLFAIEPSKIALFIPIFIFGIVFGLSTDYEVFLISRIQEIYHQTGDNDQATLEGLALTSKIITSAAAIMVVITGAFAFTGVMPVKQLGVGIALAIFIDATIVRMILVPSMMKLLGKWNWWAPRPFRKKRTDISQHDG